MKIILDTHVYLWALAEPKRIPEPKLGELKTLSNTVYVSAISIAEIAIRSSLGKLTVNFDPVSMIESSGFEKLDFSCEDSMVLKDLPFHHRDPFDRMLIAQSLARGYAVLTLDDKFKAYDCKLV